MCLLNIVCVGLLAGVSAGHASDSEALVQHEVFSHGIPPAEASEEATEPDQLTTGLPEISAEPTLTAEALTELHMMSDQDASARVIFKVPNRFVDQVNKLQHGKRHNVNFQGSMDFTHPKTKKDRFWIIDWIRDHFQANDLLRITDPPPGWKKMGQYDLSLTPKVGYPNGAPKGKPDMDKLDQEYYQGLADSWFTLCPRGDKPFSYRLWEAPLSRSICVVSSLSEDVTGPLCWIPYKYVLANSSLLTNATNFPSRRWLKSITDYNYNMFIKYQTLFRGDNSPAMLSPAEGENCASMLAEGS